MIRNARPLRRPTPRARTAFEGLEDRRLFAVGAAAGLFGPIGAGASVSAGTLVVISSSPARGDTQASSPTALSAVFSEAIAPGTLGDDLRLVRVGADGSETPEDLTIAETLDAGGTTLIGTLPAGALPPGEYRLILSANSSLAGIDGAKTSGVDRVLSDFEVRPPSIPGPRLADAVDLGALGASKSPVVAAGTLDLAADPGGAELYRVTLPAGGPWRLGAEVTSIRDGGSLGTTLALFDAGGHVLSTARFGRADVPGDPYLFAGLGPGTYYLGVSAKGDVPGLPGGYDPSTGTPGAGVPSQPGGAFRLHAVADALTGPTTLLKFAVDHADTQDSAPTGLTLQFSAPLGFARDAAGEPASDLAASLLVVDSSGKSWPLMASGYDEAKARLSVLFEQALPAGHYTVVLPGQGALTDLAGRPPVARGQAPGILASFDVAPARVKGDPLDLGPLYPQVVATGVARSFDVAPGAPASLRFVVTAGGFYAIDARIAGGTVAIGGLAIGAGGSDVVDLEPGVYTLTFLAGGPAQAHVDFTIKSLAGKTHSELLLPNGVGQGPALDLRLISPTAGDAPSAGSTAAPHAATNVGGVPSAGAVVSTGLFLSPGGEAVGRLSGGPAPIGAVGPTGASNSLALASGGVGALQGPKAPPLTLGQRSAGTTRPIAPGRGDDGAIATDGAIVALVLPQPREVPAPRGAGPDAEGGGWVDRLRETLASWVAPRVPEMPTGLPADVSEAVATAGVRREVDGPVEPEVEEAGFGSYLGMGIAAILAAHFGRNLRGRPARGRVPARTASRRPGSPSRPSGRPRSRA